MVDFTHCLEIHHDHAVTFLGICPHTLSFDFHNMSWARGSKVPEIQEQKDKKGLTLATVRERAISKRHTFFIRNTQAYKDTYALNPPLHIHLRQTYTHARARARTYTQLHNTLSVHIPNLRWWTDGVFQGCLGAL